MILISFKQTKRPVSFVLLCCLIFELALPLQSTAAAAQSGGGGTVASSLSSMVDGYTGDFNYSVPLVTVPGPNGENVSVSANYHAGIAVNQKASWLGLGWDYNPGEITRQVVGAPDDYNGVTVNQYFGNTSPSLTHQKTTAMFGSLYNNNINTNPYAGDPNSMSYTKSGDNKSAYYNLTENDRCDMIAACGPSGSSTTCYDPNFTPTSNVNYRFNKHTVPYTGLAYDQYNVSGEGIGGALHPYHLGEVQVHQEVNAVKTGMSVSAKKCQFHFENSSIQSVNMSNYTSGTVVNQTTNRIHSGTYVKYFTNYEINNNANLYSYTNKSGYLDYKPITNLSTVRRTLPDQRPDVIGAFQITNTSGITYHYSLPVYQWEDVTASFDNNGNSQVMRLASCPYATSWKLTAITGPDYEDANGNYTADEGDLGYWISYNYSLWSDNYEWASQRYNAKSDALISAKMVNLMTTSTAVGNQYKKNNSLSFGRGQVYALNYIKTASHTAYFVKSIRMDEQSYNNVINTSAKPIASLKLDRVVLLRNEDKNLLINSTGMATDPRFDYSTCVSALTDQNFINVTRYTNNKAAIDKAALTTAELGSNYSLAKKYIGNINNSFSTSFGYFSLWPIPGHHVSGSPLPNSVYKVLTAYTGSTDFNNSGKLTLKKVTIYNLNGEKITPSIDFDYGESLSSKNPDFNVDKTDLWGYYKSDYVNSHYVTSASKDYVDAWSLREINTSLGGKIVMTYESDRYHREGFNGDAPFYQIFTGNLSVGTVSSNKPHLIFPISNIGNNSDVTFFDNDFGSFYLLAPEPGYGMYGVYSKLEQCLKPAQPYNGGNSWFPAIVYQHLVRYGNVLPASGGSGAGPYPSLLVGMIPEFTFNCQPGYGPTTLSSNIGVPHAVCFRSYLYGGGVRVNKISVTDPFSGNTYTQKFEYGDGYCPVVPKPNAFSTHNGPSNHDVVMNTKPLIDSKLTGWVGYDFCKQYSLNSKNETSGSITQTFANSTLTNPLSLTTKAMTEKLERVYAFSRLAPNNPGGCQDPRSGTGGPTFYDYTIREDLSLVTSHHLGKIESVSDGSSTTSYNYGGTAISENYVHPTSEDVKYTFSFPYPAGSTTGCVFIYDKTDHYIFDKSAFRNVFSVLLSTSTTKDGITITESTARDGYTGAPIHTTVTDPTRGVFDTYTTYAYTETLPNTTTLVYPSFNLKSKNESNSNMLTPVSSTKTVKGNAYIISESKATYSNVYPLRVRFGNTPNYGTSNITKQWYHLHETFERLLDDDVPESAVPTGNDWRKVSTNTLYDFSYNCIEQEGLNGRKTASRWGYKNMYKLASVTNANYNSFTFSGFEDAVIGPGNNNVLFGGEVSHGETAQGPTTYALNPTFLIKPHTGFSMAGVAPNQAGPGFNASNFEIGRTYIAKVWVHKLSPPTATLSLQLNGNLGSTPYSLTKTVARNNQANITVGDWVLMSTEIEVPDNFNLSLTHNMSVTLSNTGTAIKAYFDDFAFHPKDAVVTGNVYNEKTGALVAQLDNDNFATFYNYDNALRLTSALKEYSGGIKKVSESEYHYAKP
ncbi:MAG: hypothetical protein K0S33_419 [Bacteroidetes bacterium]|jgi:hypothetical protein|nr:hypothetical protein [Bacteroidota bacterium]